VGSSVNRPQYERTNCTVGLHRKEKGEGEPELDGKKRLPPADMATRSRLCSYIDSELCSREREREPLREPLRLRSQHGHGHGHRGADAIAAPARATRGSRGSLSSVGLPCRSKVLLEEQTRSVQSVVGGEGKI